MNRFHKDIVEKWQVKNNPVEKNVPKPKSNRRAPWWR
jgi:hypothetical protein